MQLCYLSHVPNVPPTDQHWCLPWRLCNAFDLSELIMYPCAIAEVASHCNCWTVLRIAIRLGEGCKNQEVGYGFGLKDSPSRVGLVGCGVSADVRARTFLIHGRRLSRFPPFFYHVPAATIRNPKVCGTGGAAPSSRSFPGRKPDAALRRRSKVLHTSLTLNL